MKHRFHSCNDEDCQVCRAARRLWDLGIRLRWITPTGVSLGVPQVREHSARGAWEAFRD